MNDKYLWDIIDGLREEIEQLRKDNNSFHGQFDDVVDELGKRGAKLKELQAEIKRLEQEHKEYRLMEQVSSNRGNSSSTHTHTKEIDKHDD